MKRHRLQSSIDELVKDEHELAITAQETEGLKTLERSIDLKKAANLKIKRRLMSVTLGRNL